MSDNKSVGQVLIEQYAKNEVQKRESYDRYMYRQMREERQKPEWVQRPDWRTTLMNKIIEIEKRLDKLEKPAEPAEDWDKRVRLTPKRD